MSGAADTLGFVGLGAIGAPMAERLLGAGFSLVVHDVREAATAPFEGRASIARSAAEVADRASAVIACLPTLSSYRDAVLGPEGLREGKAMTRYLHIGTTGGVLVKDIAAALSERGVDTLDAPMTGGVPRAITGELTVIVAGPSDAATQMRPVFEAYAKRIVYVGEEVGAAQTVKLINNMLSAANLAVACEALTLGVKAGIPAETILEVINSGTGQSDASLTKLPRHVLTRAFAYGGAMAITLKDTEAYEKEAERLGASHEIASAVRRTYLAASENGFSDADMTAVALHFEHLAGLAQPPS